MQTDQYRGLTLDSFQRQALDHVRQRRSVLVSAPTGTGKTIIADFVCDQMLAEGRQVIYTAPIKALSNQKYRDYCRLHGRERVGLVTGDLVINRDAQLRVMTTEILRNMLLMREEMPQLGYVIFDEIHFLDDRERGTVWEEVLIYLPREVKILGLSATLSNLQEFADWLSAVRDEPVETIVEERRSVPLEIMIGNREGVQDPGRYRGAWRRWAKNRERGGDRPGSKRKRGRRGPQPRSRRPQPTAPWELLGQLSPHLFPVLYFAFSRRMCEQFAYEFCRRSRHRLLGRQDRDELDGVLAEFERNHPGVLSEHLERMLFRGVAFHHAGVHVALKALVEQLYERRLVRCLFCTSTFALGINMPARTVVFHGLRKFNGRAVVPLTVREFMQKAGRAGRRGLDDQGFVILRLDFEEWKEHAELVQQYQRGEHEPVNSAFNLTLNSVVNLLRHHDREEVREILERSFLNFRHQRRAQELRQRVDDAESRLRAQGWKGHGHPPARRFAKEVRRLAGWRREQQAVQSTVFDQFLAKVGLLETLGYLDEDGSFNSGALVLLHLQIEEVFATELVLSGLLEQLEDDLLFGALCSLVHNLPRGVSVSLLPDEPQRELEQQLRNLRYSHAVRMAESDAGVPVTYGAELIGLGRAWFRGTPLSALMSHVRSGTDMSGDLVSAFRRAKDLAGQLRRVHRDDPHEMQRYSALMKTVTRDEVEVLD